MNAKKTNRKNKKDLRETEVSAFDEMQGSDANLLPVENYDIDDESENQNGARSTQ